jgi:hypothetical protein
MRRAHERSASHPAARSASRSAALGLPTLRELNPLVGVRESQQIGRPTTRRSCRSAVGRRSGRLNPARLGGEPPQSSGRLPDRGEVRSRGEAPRRPGFVAVRGSGPGGRGRVALARCPISPALAGGGDGITRLSDSRPKWCQRLSSRCGRDARPGGARDGAACGRDRVGRVRAALARSNMPGNQPSNRASTTTPESMNRLTRPGRASSVCRPSPSRHTMR